VRPQSTSQVPSQPRVGGSVLRKDIGWGVWQRGRVGVVVRACPPAFYGAGIGKMRCLLRVCRTKCPFFFFFFFFFFFLPFR